MRHLILIAAFFASSTFAAESLPSYKIEPKQITISGISSGAYMAVQMHVAFSKLFSGVASVAGGTYWCAKGSLQKGQLECMGLPNRTPPTDQIAKVKELAAAGEIDPIENLRDQKIYIFSSPKDTVVHASNGDRLQQFYSAFLDPAQIKRESSVPAAHGYPTLDAGSPCGKGGLPWLLKCNFDEAGEILTSMYGTLNAKGAFVPEHLHSFSQKEFAPGEAPLFESGWVYVPATCAAGEPCKLHVALHGCQMNPDYIGDQFASQAGYNEWAETNHIIVLYPQSAKIAESCWDWLGFTGPNYMLQTGTQMAALKKMIDRVRGE